MPSLRSTSARRARGSRSGGPWPARCFKSFQPSWLTIGARRRRLGDRVADHGEVVVRLVQVEGLHGGSERVDVTERDDARRDFERARQHRLARTGDRREPRLVVTRLHVARVPIRRRVMHLHAPTHAVHSIGAGLAEVAVGDRRRRPWRRCAAVRRGARAVRPEVRRGGGTRGRRRRARAGGAPRRRPSCVLAGGRVRPSA